MKNETWKAAIAFGQVPFPVSEPFQPPVPPRLMKRKAFLSRKFDQVLSRKIDQSCQENFTKTLFS
jgi:hypothetical protein